MSLYFIPHVVLSPHVPHSHPAVLLYRTSQVCKWIHAGVHLRAGEEVYISWGRRLLHCPGLVYLNSQLLILKLLADYPDEAGLPQVWGGGWRWSGV